MRRVLFSATGFRTMSQQPQATDTHVLVLGRGLGSVRRPLQAGRYPRRSLRRQAAFSASSSEGRRPCVRLVLPEHGAGHGRSASSDDMATAVIARVASCLGVCGRGRGAPCSEKLGALAHPSCSRGFGCFRASPSLASRPGPWSLLPSLCGRTSAHAPEANPLASL